MLAPRKKLWSTPDNAIDVARDMVPLTSEDVLYDVGCGDGRVLIHLAATTQCRRFVGIEINSDRANEAKTNIQIAQDSGSIPSDCQLDIRCMNALDVLDYEDASVIFLYLVPRGLRIMKPLLKKASLRRTQQDIQSGQELHTHRKPGIHVVTYMAGFDDESPVAKRTCEVPHQKGSAWPIYLYRF